VSPLWKETGDLVTRDTEKDEVLNDFFSSVFISKGSSHITQARKSYGKILEKILSHLSCRAPSGTGGLL